MPRDRLVFDVPPEKKEAFSQVLREDGVSVNEWFQEQLDLALDLPKIASYDELDDAEGLRDPQVALSSLREIDWAFTDDDTQYLSHQVHPYPARFIPQIPGHLIARLSFRGEVVLDPFGGGGTTSLEAARLGRRSISVDANPLAGLIGRVKTSRLDQDALADLRLLQGALLARADQSQASPEQLLSEFSAYVPPIPNLAKWFPATSCSELALIRSCMSFLTNQVAREIASVALSRVVLKVSFQDSETRYASKEREIPAGFTTKRFLHDLRFVLGKLRSSSEEVQYSVADFVTADSRAIPADVVPDSSVDLVVTSPPYGNSYDYHLYHRFRLFWLGFDPKDLARVEIGSHLRHQREKSGFDSYMADLEQSLAGLHRVIKPGRYCCFVIGDPVYEGKTYDVREALEGVTRIVGFESVGSLIRPIHTTRRSVVKPGRRADREYIVVMRRPAERRAISLNPPAYRMWDFEEELRWRETRELIGAKRKSRSVPWKHRCLPEVLPNARRLAFTRSITFTGGFEEPTWQGILENGLGDEGAKTRKDPKYVTHGLHPYKGKFYPQLAKGLLNAYGVGAGSVVLDPFCGSGTTLLEGRLNGLRSHGCDLNPLAVKIASAKVGILDVSPSEVAEVSAVLAAQIQSAPRTFPRRQPGFSAEALPEIENWFPKPVVAKLGWLLDTIRAVSTGTLREFYEVVLSSIIRDVSHQDPRDLRIRKRKEPLKDADVLGLFTRALDVQRGRLEHFWSVRGYCPYPLHHAVVGEVDSRDVEAFGSLGIEDQCVDFVLTSPPYATALPYIDTDRLSLLVLCGIASSSRGPLERSLIGSREIRKRAKNDLDELIHQGAAEAGLPASVFEFIENLHRDNLSDDVGFRRRNLPALLLRFFCDMERVFENVARVLKPGGDAVFVVGDNYTQVKGEKRSIPTTEFLADVGGKVGLRCVERMPITVTRENMKHAKHAITENTVLRFKAPMKRVSRRG